MTSVPGMVRAMQIAFYLFMAAAAPILHAAETMHERRGHLVNETARATCSLEECWSEVFGQSSLITASADIIQAYKNGLHRKLNEITLAKAKVQTERAKIRDLRKDQNAEPQLLLEEEIKVLDLELGTLQNYLNECNALRSGSWTPKHIIIAGRAFKGDGDELKDPDSDNNKKAAQTQKDELIGKCKKETPTEDCENSVVVIVGPEKDELRDFFRLLAPNSVSSISYWGHGIPTGLTMGEKNILVPPKYYNNMKIPGWQWQLLNQGMFYSGDIFDEVGQELTRVLVKKSEVELLACNAGNDFGKHLKGALPDANVKACLSGSEFRFKLKETDSSWKHPGSNPVPKNAAATTMISESNTGFTNYYVEMSAASSPPAPLEVAVPEYSPEDATARDVLFRAAWKSSDKAVLPNGEILLFTLQERELLVSMFKDQLSKNGWKDGTSEYTAAKIQEVFNAQRDAYNADIAKGINRKDDLDRLLRLKDKLARSAKASREMYYQ